jgi:hypothetical protein
MRRDGSVWGYSCLFLTASAVVTLGTSGCAYQMDGLSNPPSGQEGTGGSTTATPSSGSSGAGGSDLPVSTPCGGRQLKKAEVAINPALLKDQAWINDPSTREISCSALIEGSFVNTDPDDYKLRIPAGGKVVRIETFASLNKKPYGCFEQSTKLALLSSVDDLLMFDPNDMAKHTRGIGDCAALVTFLPEGIYRVRVTKASSMKDEYFLDIRFMTDAGYMSKVVPVSFPANAKNVFIQGDATGLVGENPWTINVSDGERLRAEVIPLSPTSNWQCYPGQSQYLLESKLSITPSGAPLPKDSINNGSEGCSLFDDTDPDASPPVEQVKSYKLTVEAMSQAKVYPFLLAVTVRSFDWYDSWPEDPAPTYPGSPTK